MRQAQLREFENAGIEPYIENRNLYATIKADVKELTAFNHVLDKAKMFGNFVSRGEGTFTYRLEEPQFGEEFGGIRGLV
jgi:hypothetical protein